MGVVEGFYGHKGFQTGEVSSLTFNYTFIETRVRCLSGTVVINVGSELSK